MALLYAAGEVESSEEEDDTTNLLSHLDKQSTPSPSLPSTDSSDGETEFMLKGEGIEDSFMILSLLATFNVFVKWFYFCCYFADLRKKPVAENKTAPPAETSESPQKGSATGWLSSVFGKSQANPPSHDDSDTDEFELIDRNEL